MLHRAALPLQFSRCSKDYDEIMMKLISGAEMLIEPGQMVGGTSWELEIM